MGKFRFFYQIFIEKSADKFVLNREKFVALVLFQILHVCGNISIEIFITMVRAVFFGRIVDYELFKFFEPILFLFFVVFRFG